MDERDLDVPVTVGAPLDERQGGQDPFGVGEVLACRGAGWLGVQGPDLDSGQVPGQVLATPAGAAWCRRPTDVARGWHAADRRPLQALELLGCSDFGDWLHIRLHICGRANGLDCRVRRHGYSGSQATVRFHSASDHVRREDWQGGTAMVSNGRRASERPIEARLLVVEDDANIVELLSASLRYAGFEVAGARDGRQALRLAREFRPDLIVLDVMLPGIDGFEVVRRLSSEGNRCPVLFLTARDAVADKITGLTVGGDDYVTKPFSLDEVIARIRAVLRRSSTGSTVPAARISFADIELDDETHQVWKAGVEVALSPTEFNLLRYFMQNAGKVLSKAQILDHVWNYDFGGDANVVESYVSYLRRKIDTTEPRLLHTLRGVGYTLRLPRP